jgi:Domain of unknown function(DUF2779)
MLGSLTWPAHYLDFETVKTAVPVLDDLGPHEVLVTQYSLHIRESPEHDCEHREYLEAVSKAKLCTQKRQDLAGLLAF